MIQSLIILLLLFLAGSRHITLPKELDHPRKGLINIQNNDDNKCFKWCLVRYLNPADHNSRRTTKSDKDFAKRPEFKDIKLSVYASKKCCEEREEAILQKKF